MKKIGVPLYLVLIMALAIGAGLFFAAFTSGRNKVRNYYQTQIENFFTVKQHQLTSQISIALSKEIQQIHEELVFMQKIEGIKDGKATECMKAMSGIVGQVDLISTNLMRMDKEGVVYCSNQDYYLGLDIKKLNTEFAKQILEDDKYVDHISPIRRQSVVAGNNYTNFINYVVPVFGREDNFDGHLVGTIDTVKLVENISKNTDININEYLILLDDNGDILYYPDTSFIGINLYSEEFKQKYGEYGNLVELFEENIKKDSGESVYYKDGKKLVAVFNTINIMPGRKWQIVLVDDGSNLRALLDPMFGAIEDQYRRVLLFFGLITLVITILIVANNYRLNRLVKERTVELEKYKMGVENASDHVVITDTEGNIIYANKGVEKITGFSQAEIIGKKAGSKELWGGQMDSRFYEKLWDTIKYKKQNFTGEIINKRKNGERYTAMASISPVLDEKGEVKYFIGLERDITKEKEVDKMKTEFVSFASHQLRTPLSAMRWFSEILLSGDVGKLTKEQKGVVENIQQSSLRMIELVGDLLDISRIESGRIIIDPKPTILSELIDGVIREVEQKAKHKKQIITTHYGKNIPTVNLDQSLIRNVFLNLLTNAIKYTPNSGEIRIEINREADYLIAKVIDNGYGIPKDQQESVFNKFFRANNAIKIETEGSGLGLYLVKTIIDSSGGKIWFQSSEGKGTAFWIKLPIKGMKAKKGEIVLGS